MQTCLATLRYGLEARRTCLAEQQVALEGKEVLPGLEATEQRGHEMRIHNAHCLKHHPLQVSNLPSHRTKVRPLR